MSDDEDFTGDEIITPGGDVFPLAEYKWEKGQSGNPSGRPKDTDADIEKIARSHMRSMVKVLVSIALDEKVQGRDRIAAAREILDRGMGKPGLREAPKAADDNMAQRFKNAATRERLAQERQFSGVKPKPRTKAARSDG